MFSLLVILISLLVNIGNSKDFKYYSYDEITSIFTDLSKTCSRFLKIDTSQNRYNLQTVNECGNKPCSNGIAYLTDFDSLTLSRPQYYVSGLVHGDEVLGPTSITEFVMYFCNESNRESSKYSLYFNLLKSKMIILTPMTNAYGYYNNKREDRILLRDSSSSYNSRAFTFDPNRDFPYFSNKEEETSQCMQTISARTINEIFNEHIITGAITFHGGISVLGYAWGNYVHYNNKTKKSTEAPDHEAFHDIGETMILVAESKNNTQNKIRDYTLGDMSSMVYPVNGGMEDWSYAGSWEDEILKQNNTTDILPIKKCVPDTFNEYRDYWTGYENNHKLFNGKESIFYDVKLRSGTYLVETSDDKRPKESTGGNDKTGNYFDFFDKNNNNYNGHIPRNIRLIYSSVDLVASSIYLNPIPVEYNETALVLDYKLMGCKAFSKVSVIKIPFNSGKQEALLEKGKVSINETNILLETRDLNCYWSDIKNQEQTLFNLTFPYNKDSDFNGTLPGDIYFIQGEGPDQTWKNQSQPDPKTPPQSHVVQSKTKPEYNVTNGNYSLYSNYITKSYPIGTSSNGYAVILDDIDAFTYLKKQPITGIISKLTDISNKYSISSKVELSRRANKSNPEMILTSSAYQFDISFSITFEARSLGNMVYKHPEYSNITKLVVNITLNSIGEILGQSNPIECDLLGTTNMKEKEYGINCYNILTQLNITQSDGYFIRNNLANAIISIDEEMANNSKIPLKLIGVFSIDFVSKGKGYTIPYSNYTCTSNIGPLNFFKTKDKIDYGFELSLSLVSNTEIKGVLVNKKINKNSNNDNNVYLIFFPFAKDYILFNATETQSFTVKISSESSGKIIGKTVNIAKISSETTLGGIKHILKDFGNLNIFQEVKDFLKNEVTGIKCSIISDNTFKGKENIEVLKGFSTLKDGFGNEEERKTGWELVVEYEILKLVGLIGVTIVFLVGFLSWLLNCIKRRRENYKTIVQEVEIGDIGV